MRIPKFAATTPRMVKVTACDVPEDSLLAGFGGPHDYRDCFVREVAGKVSLEDYVERFYCSAAFRPERVLLGLIGRGANAEDIRALARGKANRIMVWKVIGRQSDQILLLSKDTGTASWFAVQPSGENTRLLFGSWVGNLEQSGWRFMLHLHLWYSRLLLTGVTFNR